MMLFERFLEPLGIYDGRTHTKKNANDPKRVKISKLGKSGIFY